MVFGVFLDSCMDRILTNLDFKQIVSLQSVSPHKSVNLMGLGTNLEATNPESIFSIYSLLCLLASQLLPQYCRQCLYNIVSKISTLFCKMCPHLGCTFAEVSQKMTELLWNWSKLENLSSSLRHEPCCRTDTIMGFCEWSTKIAFLRCF